jgi:hypothetical protein
MTTATETTPTLAELATLFETLIAAHTDAHRKAHALGRRKFNTAVRVELVESMAGTFSVRVQARGARTTMEFDTPAAPSREAALSRAHDDAEATVVEFDLIHA